MKGKGTKLLAGILVAVALALSLITCSGPTGTSNQEALLAPSPVPTSPTRGAAPATGQQPTNQAAPSTSELLAKGKLIFEKTAGGVGCAYCHGLDGKGGGTSGFGAPPNRGKTEAEVRAALMGVPAMSFIKLSDDEIAAVVAYLQYLNQLP
jgi:mono/diheme cytochrome c family protein